MKQRSTHSQTKVMQKYLTSTQKVLVAVSLSMSFVAFAFAFTLLPNKHGEKPLCSYISCPRSFTTTQQEKRVRAPMVKNPRAEQATLAVYESYLNYPSMQEVAKSLESLQLLTTSNTLLPSRDLILRTLTGYNANNTTEQKKLFFEKTFSDIQFQYPKEKEFVMRVVHALWFEKNGGANWSLKDYSTDEIAILLWTPGYAGGIPIGTATNIPLLQYPQSFFEDVVYPDSFRREGMYALHQLAMKFKKSSIKESLLAAIYWQKKNFFHAYTDYNWNVYKDNQTEANKIGMGTGSIYLPTSMERLFDERVTGCHEHSLLISDYLRAMNIPAANINHVGHGVLFVPSLNAYVHGDHIADMHVMPPEDYLITADQIISAGAQNYGSILRNKYPYPQHYFPNTQLARKGTQLFLHTDSVTGTIPQSDWDIMVSQVPEFNLKYDKETGISSDFVPIQTLEELSK